MQPEEYSTYEAMKLRGDAPETICFAMRAKGHEFSACIILLRQLFPLSLMQAKEVFVRTDGFKSLSDYQESLLPDIEWALNALERSANKDQK
ncbi:hypothetical protein [Roseimicrobium sp. ORNL1]|uniref:hypothetical protein n=1 Tax=Roseimicrobium sp. ORNL1 TaxID=2711231 RepID=UPI0013E16405|nr:hypothetical protein [Roseimicrobium sp. ORNL1]QIF01325.1 hypothetical protein G5S37_07255 [Roseimicrobium sp. ORNL1]